MFVRIALRPSFTTVTDPCKASVLATLSGSALCVARTRKSTLLMVSVVKIHGLTEIAEFYKKYRSLLPHSCRFETHSSKYTLATFLEVAFVWKPCALPSPARKSTLLIIIGHSMVGQCGQKKMLHHFIKLTLNYGH